MRLRPALVVVLIAAGCGGAGTASAPARGWMAGVALTGRRVCPAPTGVQGTLCHPSPRPHAVVVVTGAAGSHRVLADASGRFRIALRPGRYSVRAGRAHLRVRVVAGRVAHVRVGIQTPFAKG
jgi:hypothetical protein